MVEAVIRLILYDPPIFTTDEWESMVRQHNAMAMADPDNILLCITACLIKNQESRYHEAKAQNEWRLAEAWAEEIESAL